MRNVVLRKRPRRTRLASAFTSSASCSIMSNLSGHSHKRVDRDHAALFDRANDERIDFGFDNAGIADGERRKPHDGAGEALKVAPGPAAIAGQSLERGNLADHL